MLQLGYARLRHSQPSRQFHLVDSQFSSKFGELIGDDLLKRLTGELLNASGANGVIEDGLGEVAEILGLQRSSPSEEGTHTA